ncbi:hypothetical protein lerEdw1_006237 [Lerista edwardsae]|nr:hypothetical protein lerEdw1_006237 [Lerista edwardsae]
MFLSQLKNRLHSKDTVCMRHPSSVYKAKQKREAERKGKEAKTPNGNHRRHNPSQESEENVPGTANLRFMSRTCCSHCCHVHKHERQDPEEKRKLKQNKRGPADLHSADGVLAMIQLSSDWQCSAEFTQSLI